MKNKIIVGMVLVLFLNLGLAVPASAVADHANTGGDPVHCPGAITLKTYTAKSNKVEVRSSAACDGIWLRKNNAVSEGDRYGFIVGYHCYEADSSCRSGYSWRKLTAGGGWTYMLDESEHDHFRVCWDDDQKPPFEACGKQFSISTPSMLGSWEGKLSRPEGHDHSVKINWSSSAVCVRDEQAGEFGIQIRTVSALDSKKYWIPKYHRWSALDIHKDYFCVRTAGMTRFEVTGCNGRACMSSYYGFKADVS